MKRDGSGSVENQEWGSRLRRARLVAGLSQRRLGIEIGLDESAANARINRYETGLHRPDLQTVRHLARVLNVPVAYFYADNEELADMIYRYAKVSAPTRKAIAKLMAEVPAMPVEVPLKHTPSSSRNSE